MKDECMSDIVYSYWKCPSCQNIIRGDCRECPSCGKPIPSDVKYKMPDDPEVISALAKGTILTSASAVTRNVERSIDEKGIISEIVPEELVFLNSNASLPLKTFDLCCSGYRDKEPYKEYDRTQNSSYLNNAFNITPEKAQNAL